MNEETEPMPLGDRRQHRRLVRFDPTFSTGSIAQILALLIGLGSAWGVYQADRASTRIELDQLKSNATSEKTEMREAIRDLRQEMRNVQQTVSSVDKTVTGIKAGIDAQKGKP
jgi:hypothetical protein